MLGGFILGSIINLFFKQVGFIDTYFVNGIFHVGGSMFVRALKMLVVPLVTFSLICGVTGMKDVSELGRVGIKSLVLYLITTAVAISTALSLAYIIGPGRGFKIDTEAASTFSAREAPPLTQVFINLIPGNPVTAFAEGNMLQIIFFVVLFGSCILLIGDTGKKLIDFSTVMNEVMMKVVTVVMHIAPYGVFCLMAKTFSQQGPALILPMFKYFIVVIAALGIHGFLTMGLILKFYGKLNPLTFYKKMRSAQIFAFSTASSNATIPVTLMTVKEKMGVDSTTASFTIPFGATINMDGTAIMQGVATIFIANVYAIDLGLIDYLTVIGMSVLASIGTAGVPGVGLIMLAMVFHQVGLPVEGIGLVLGVDRLLDMCRTAINITGDSMVTTLIAKGEGTLNIETFNNPDAGTQEP